MSLERDFPYKPMTWGWDWDHRSSSIGRGMDYSGRKTPKNLATQGEIEVTFEKKHPRETFNVKHTPGTLFYLLKGRYNKSKMSLKFHRLGSDKLHIHSWILQSGLKFEPLSHSNQTILGLKFDTQTEGLGQQNFNRICVWPPFWVIFGKKTRFFGGKNTIFEGSCPYTHRFSMEYLPTFAIHFGQTVGKYTISPMDSMG